MKLSVAAAALLALLLFGVGFVLGGRGSARLRDAYRDTVAMDREAARVSDSLADTQRLADSARVAEATHAAAAAQARAGRSGAALPGQLPSVPDAVTVLDTAQTRILKESLAAFARSLAEHLRDDSVAAADQARLVATLRLAERNALADALAMRLERDRITNQLAGAVTHLRSGHSVLVDVVIAAGGFAVGHVLR